MSEQNDAGTIYRKVGRRYHPVDQSFLGKPAPGVWIVQDRPGMQMQMRVARLGDLPDPMPAAAIYQHIDVAIRALLDCLDKSERTDGAVNVGMLVDAIFQAIAKAEQKGEQEWADADA